MTLIAGNQIRWSRSASFRTILALVLSCTLSCNWVGPRVFRVPTGAMEPTIKAGDEGLTDTSLQG